MHLKQRDAEDADQKNYDLRRKREGESNLIFLNRHV